MNIGLLSAASSIHTVKIANGLAELGHSVTLYSLPNHRDSDGALDARVKLVYLKYGGRKGYILNRGNLKTLIAAQKNEVLNVHYASGYGTLGTLAGFEPYVLSIWGSDVYEFPEKSALHRRLIKSNLSKANLILSTSSIMARRARRYIKGKEIVVTPFGIDIDAFSPAHAPKRDEINIGIVKMLAPKYGIKELIFAFNNMLKWLKDKNLRLSIYGDGPQRSELETLSKELGVADRVCFYGKIPHAEVPKVLHDMDIFCAPSTSDSESFGVAVVEAMACGIPCVTSDADGFAEVMVDGETGFIVPKKDVDSLAEKMAVLVNDAGLRKRMGQAGRARAVALYNWQDNIMTIAEALTEAQKRHS